MVCRQLSVLMEHSTNMCSHKRETATEKLTMFSLTLVMTVSSETNLSCENIWSSRELHLGAVVNFLPNTSGCGCRRLLCEHFRRHPLRFRCRRVLSEQFRRHPLRFRCRRLLSDYFRRHPLRFLCRRLLSELFRRHPLLFRCRRLLSEDFRR